MIGDYGYDWEEEYVPSLLHFRSAEGPLYKNVPGSKGEYRNIDWSPDGSLLATANNVLRVWSKEGVLLYESPHDGMNYLWGICWNK